MIRLALSLGRRFIVSIQGMPSFVGENSLSLNADEIRMEADRVRGGVILPKPAGVGELRQNLTPKAIREGI